MRISRKMEHVDHALRLGQSGEQGFADLMLVPNALPEASFHTISLRTRIGELELGSPIFINAMTGGAPETEEINRGLAEAAKACGLAMAVGSQMSAIKDPAMRSSYEIVRKTNPDGIVIANIGSEATVDQARLAVEMLEADALQIHLNVMQELIMPEGDRDFRGMTERIGTIVQELPVPVIVKEVGFGMNGEAAYRLKSKLGVRILDVGGTGGTNFAAIENARRSVPIDWLNGWGMTTSTALLEALKWFGGGDVIASGGIRTSMDVVKALALGASAVGLAGSLLKVWKDQGSSALVDFINTLHDGVRLVMTSLGAEDIPQLKNTPVIIRGDTAEWCRLRDIDIAAYARRKRQEPF